MPNNVNLLIGSKANDVLTGGDGTDIVLAFGGDDHVVLGGGYDLAAGGEGVDTIDYSGATGGIILSLDDHIAVESTYTGPGTVGSDDLAGATLDLLFGFENVVGSAFGDQLTGNDADNVIWGGAGDDAIIGGLGLDTLSGGSGADSFFLAGLDQGADTIIDFTSADDTLLFSDAVFSADAGLEPVGSGNQVGAAFFVGESGGFTDIFYSTSGIEAEAVLVTRVSGWIDPGTDFQFYTP